MSVTTDEVAAPAASEREAALEDRIRRLEAALAERAAPAAAADPDAVTDRVIAKLSAMAGASGGADRVLVLASDGSQQLAPPPPNGAVLHPPVAPGTDPIYRRWFFTQLWAEVQLAFRMYFDPHYRLSRTTQFAIPGIALLLVFNYFFFSVWVSIIFVSPVIERVLAVALGVLGYKLIVRELARYRDVLEYMARYGVR
jgi:hypothetical protein